MKNEYRQLFKSNAVYVIYIFCLMSVMSQCNSCSHGKENERLRKEVNGLQLELDSLVINFSEELVNRRNDGVYYQNCTCMEDFKN